VKINGNLKLQEGTQIENLTLPSGNEFPDQPNNAELFCLNIDLPGYPKGQYRHDGARWLRQADHAETSTICRIRPDMEYSVHEDYQLTVQDTLTVEGILNVDGEVYVL